ncbi:MAG TPA: SLBB domain-containing protein, partial [Roseiflexaceae bacterium]|nr:SLBB domain-containing protein [Roseiflexaceae bacterium]
MAMQQGSGWLSNKTYIFAGIVLALSMMLLWVTFGGGQDNAGADANVAMLAAEPEPMDNTLPADMAVAATPAPQAPELAVVYISGAVRNPDVYRVPAAARVKDVVLAAGGLAEDADAERINLA